MIKLVSIKSLKSLITVQVIGSNITKKQINILIAAIELFYEKGYRKTATSEIAKRADVAEGTIFHYYKTKKHLLLALPGILRKISIIEDFFDDFNVILNDDYENFEEFLKKLIRNVERIISETEPILKVIIQEMPFEPELRAKILNIDPSLKRLIVIIEKFKAKGELIDVPSESIVNLIISSIFGYFLLNYVALPELKSDEQYLNYLVKYIVNAVGRHDF